MARIVVPQLSGNLIHSIEYTPTTMERALETLFQLGEPICPDLDKVWFQYFRTGRYEGYEVSYTRTLDEEENAFPDSLNALIEVLTAGSMGIEIARATEQDNQGQEIDEFYLYHQLEERKLSLGFPTEGLEKPYHPAIYMASAYCNGSDSFGVDHR